MATTSLITHLFILLSISNSYSLSTSPQNIQTFYPFSPPSNNDVPPPTPDRFSFPPPTAALPPPSPPHNSSTRVGRAIGVTAASTLVFSVLLFFLLTKYNSRRKKEEHVASGDGAATPQNGGFMRYGGVKGLIVDESGLDVLYWKNLQEGEQRSSFKKQYYESLREEEKRVVSEGERKRKPPVQEIPLLDGKSSSSSQSPSWAERDYQIIEKTPSFSNKVNVKNVATPLPPPPGVSQPSLIAKTPPPPPPPPPPPKVAVGAVSNGKTAAPPPPPIPSKKGPGPPPPPPPTSAGESSSEKVKFKPLHWDKVNPNLEHSMVWDKIEKGSFKFDGDLMEALFGSVATNRNSPPILITKASTPPSPIFILDPRKSQNTAIVLKSLAISRREIIDALIEGRTLDTDSIEKLARIAPTDEESSQIIAFNGDPTRLADAESFLFHLLRSIPTAFRRFNAMLFRSNYDSEVSSIKESLQSIGSACNELRTRGLFLKLLEAVLKAGNRLNAGTERGNAQAFNLAALRKLSDVKSSDGKTTLLQFVVQEVVRAEGKRCVLNRNRTLSRTSNRSRNGAVQTSDNTRDEREREYMMLGLPIIGGLSAEFSNVKKSATFDYDVLNKSISELTTQVIEIRKVLQQCGGNGGGGGFEREIEAFLDTADLEVKLVKEEQIRIMELVKKTTDYYQAGSSKDKSNPNPFQLFVIVRDFLEMVDAACIEISRNVQKRKSAPSVAGSSSPESARVFMFPKLPANFMSDNSKSSSSDSDSDL